MTYAQMIQSLGTRMGGTSTLARLFPEYAEIDAALSEAQLQVADEMIIFHGATYAPDIDHDADGRAFLSSPTADIADGADCTLPECYHPSVVIGAERILAQKMGDNAPTHKNPSKLWQEFQEALLRAHKVYATSLNASSPNRLQDGYAPYRHLEEDF